MRGVSTRSPTTGNRRIVCYDVTVVYVRTMCIVKNRRPECKFPTYRLILQHLIRPIALISCMRKLKQWLRTLHFQTFFRFRFSSWYSCQANFFSIYVDHITLIRELCEFAIYDLLACINVAGILINRISSLYDQYFPFDKFVTCERKYEILVLELTTLRLSQLNVVSPLRRRFANPCL